MAIHKLSPLSNSRNKHRHLSFVSDVFVAKLRDDLLLFVPCQKIIGKKDNREDRDGIVIPCYCTCDSFGHDNLLYCFYKNGDLKDGFDDHGAQCAVCIRQALLAFLWDDLGAAHDEIMKGMEQKFAPLIEKYHQHEH